MLLDTQILSFAHKGEWPIEEDSIPAPSPEGIYIPSTAAQEFLESQVEDPAQARYYIPLTKDPIEIEGLFKYARKEDTGFTKNYTDKFVVNTPKEYNSQREFGHKAISNVINKNLHKLFKASIQGLSKSKIKKLKERVLFSMNSGLKCLPLSKSISDVGVELLELFLKNNEPKKNFKNIFNDIMILAMSEELNYRLWTEDRLLAKFASNNLGRDIKRESGLFEVLSKDENTKEMQKGESKGYINTRIRQIMKQGRGEG